ncbi:MAG: amidinotransferase, partial [Chloroflexi bacterium]|nr:amidinotransferase [Chloroflexota bacterium]
MTTLLMCPPAHFRIAYEINPWMDVQRDADRALAQRQWQALYDALTAEAGARVRLVEPAAEQPDMVFTANAGLVVGRRFLPSNFRHPERAGERGRFCDWMVAAGYTLAPLPEAIAFEGEGDVLFCGDLPVAGYGFRTDRAAHRVIEQALDWPVLSLELVDPHFYHLDTCFL